MKKIAWVHIDIISRIKEIENKSYPRSHLWGYPYDNTEDIHILNPIFNLSWLKFISNIYDYITRSRFGNLLIEISLLIQIKQFNSIYCISGKLFWIPIFKRIGLIKTKLIILVYRIPEPSPFWKLHNLHLSKFILEAFDGINCLTKKTADDLFCLLGKKKDIEYIPWCTDEKLFVNENNSKSNYFFSSGKTNRDYETLLNAILKSPEIHFLIIGHFTNAKPTNQHTNLRVIHSDKIQTDTAIPYKVLKEHYSQSIAICISLNGDPNDTCGYTELLEAMSMSKPVLMTRSGCLDINIEKENIGYYVNPKDPLDWMRKINLIFENSEKAKKMGKNGRKLVEKIYNISSHEKRVRDFLTKITCP